MCDHLSGGLDRRENELYKNSKTGSSDIPRTVGTGHSKLGAQSISSKFHHSGISSDGGQFRRILERENTSQHSLQTKSFRMVVPLYSDCSARRVFLGLP